MALATIANMVGGREKQFTPADFLPSWRPQTAGDFGEEDGIKTHPSVIAFETIAVAMGWGAEHE